MRLILLVLLSLICASSVLAEDCDIFPDKLAVCEPFRCQFQHPFTGETLNKEIKGMIDGKCLYIEEMPNHGLMKCQYNEQQQKAVATYYKDLKNADTYGTKFHAEIGADSQQQTATYTINGQEVNNPLDAVMNDGTCQISGY